MPPKKKAESKAKKKDDVELEGHNPAVLYQNYKKMCKNMGIPENPKLGAMLLDEEAHPVTQLNLDPDFGTLGPGGARALATAILGTGPGMQGGPYKLLKCIRIWRSFIGDDGAIALAELLRVGGDDVVLAYLELMDNKIGPRGAAAIGRALMSPVAGPAGSPVPPPTGGARLLTLKLNNNDTLGSEGVAALCAGLRCNTTLKQLHLEYCQIGPEGGTPLCELIAAPSCTLHTLNLQGNMLANRGLATFSIGLRRSKSLLTLNLADNGIEFEADSIIKFRDALLHNATLLRVDFMFNSIGGEGASILSQALAPTANTTLKSFKVDSKLPPPLFAALQRTEGGGKKKKGGKKGGKKKKK